MREEQMQEAPVKVLLVGVDIGEEADFEHSMEELASLAEAAEKEVVGQIVQRLDHVNKALYIGTGKVAEVRRLAEERGAQEVVFDNSLTPSQVRNLGKELELTVIDRTNLILDIFAIRAQTREAKLQVETARLQYMLPRLVGMYDALSRQGGASGSWCVGAEIADDTFHKKSSNPFLVTVLHQLQSFLPFALLRSFSFCIFKNCSQ